MWTVATRTWASAKPDGGAKIGDETIGLLLRGGA